LSDVCTLCHWDSDVKCDDTYQRIYCRHMAFCREHSTVATAKFQDYRGVGQLLWIFGMLYIFVFIDFVQFLNVPSLVTHGPLCLKVP
jgi:hypothetical protein